MKRHIYRQLLSGLLVLIMVLGLIPLTVFAEDRITLTSAGATFNTARLAQITPGFPICAYEDTYETTVTGTDPEPPDDIPAVSTDAAGMLPLAAAADMKKFLLVSYKI